MAFLLNQMNVGAFKINTLEKPEMKTNTLAGLKSTKGDFSKELRAAVDEKRSVRNVDEPSYKKFEKKLSKVNQDSKQKFKENIEDRVSEKASSKSLEKITGKSEAKETITPDEKLSPVENQSTNPVEPEKKMDGTEKSEKTLNTEDVQKTASPEEAVTPEELAGKIASSVNNVTAVLMTLIQQLNPTAETKKGVEEVKAKAEELLKGIEKGTVPPEQGIKELQALVVNLEKLTKSLPGAEKGNDGFKGLMEITGDKLKVLKNEIADARDVMNRNDTEAKRNIASAKAGIPEKMTAPEEEKVLETNNVIAKAADPKSSNVVDEPKEDSETKVDVLAANLANRATAKSTEPDSKENKEEMGKSDSRETTINTKAEKSESTDEKPLMKGSDEKVSSGPVKTERNANPVNFDQTLSSTVKESAKVQEAAKTSRVIQPDKAEVLSQIVKKADLLVGKTHSEMIMRLEPENLGKVTLKIAVEKGNLTATFQADNQQVKALIENNTNSLREMLQEKGINISAINVSVNQQNGENPNWQNNNNNFSFGSSMKSRNSSNEGSNSGNSIYGNLDGILETEKAKNPYTRHDGSFDSKG